MAAETREQGSANISDPHTTPEVSNAGASNSAVPDSNSTERSAQNTPYKAEPAPFTAVGPNEEGLTALTEDNLPMQAVSSTMQAEEPSAETAAANPPASEKRAPAATANSYRDIIAQRLAAKTKPEAQGDRPQGERAQRAMAHSSSRETAKPVAEASTEQLSAEASTPRTIEDATRAMEASAPTASVSSATASATMGSAAMNSSATSTSSAASSAAPASVSSAPVSQENNETDIKEGGEMNSRERARLRQRERAELRRQGRRSRPAGLSPVEGEPDGVDEIPMIPAPPTSTEILAATSSEGTAPAREAQPREQSRERRPREERNRDDRPREERPREERAPREDRPREDRREARPERAREERAPREDRVPREERPREERPREERTREGREERRPEMKREERRTDARPDARTPREGVAREGMNREGIGREGMSREGVSREGSRDAQRPERREDRRSDERRSDERRGEERRGDDRRQREEVEEIPSSTVLDSLKGGAPQQSQSDFLRAKALASKLGISVVIPLYNEQESLRELTAALKAQLIKLAGSRYEIIYVNDGSTDRSGQILSDIIRGASRVTALSFRRNMGKSAGLAAGFKEVKYGIVITMDADLQDDPREIPNLIAKLDDGYDLVSGWKKKRYDPVTKTAPSKFFNSVTSFFAGVKLHDFNCGLKGYRKEVVDSLDVYGEMHRYLPALAHWKGFRVTEIPVVHHPRKFGKSKFGSSRFFKGFLDLLSIVFTNRYGKRPLHLFGTVGTVLAIIGTIIDLWVSVEWMIGSTSLSNRPILLLGVLLILVGVQLISLGLLGEMVVKNSVRGIDVSMSKEKSTKMIDDRDRDRRRARVMRGAPRGAGEGREGRGERRMRPKA